jgi:tryptophan-rich sensory protein
VVEVAGTGGNRAPTNRRAARSTAPTRRSGASAVRRTAPKPAAKPKNKGVTAASKGAPTRKQKRQQKKRQADQRPEKVEGKQQKAAKLKAKQLKRNQRRQQGLGRYLQKPDLQGPKVTIGILWFIVASGSVLTGRWATVAVFAVLAGFAASQVTTAWDSADVASPPFSKVSAGVGAVAIVGCMGIGTSLGGAMLMAVPLVIAIVHVMFGFRPADAGAALIGTILASIASASVVLVERQATWAALFLVTAVSLYDAGYFIGAAESTSRIEGPVTGMIGVLAVTFAAGALQTEPFDTATAWMAGGLIAVACPFGQMITSAFLPNREAPAPAMRRLDAYLVAAPMMFGSVLAVGG